MNHKKSFNMNLIYIATTILFVTFQCVRLYSLSNVPDIYGFEGVVYPYLILLGSLPIMILVFLFMPALFVVKVTTKITFKITLPHASKSKIYNVKPINIYKPKQSSLQVFRC